MKYDEQTDPTKLRYLRTTKLPVIWCPHCVRRVDAATSVHGQKPDPGSLTICMYCHEPAAYNDQLQLRRLTPAEQEYFDNPPEGSSVAEVKALLAKVRSRP